MRAFDSYVRCLQFDHECIVVGSFLAPMSAAYLLMSKHIDKDVFLSEESQDNHPTRNSDISRLT